MDIQALIKEVEEKSKLVAEKALEKAKVTGLQAQLKVVESDAYQEALVGEAIEMHKQESMKALIEQCKVVISNLPIVDKATRKTKVWNGRPLFGLGKDMELLHNLCTGILYSVEQHKVPMVGLTGLNLVAIEQFVTSLGRTAYYNETLSAIVDEVPTNVEALRGSVLLLSQQLGLALDTSLLTQQVINTRSTQAYNKADRERLEAELVPDTQFTME